ncbi:MAG: ATP-binding cassette domain-containing protein [Puniceicoccales bacterium]|jgi:putative ABC transport system ATP-binding protein|nr:ATP-binding cassette domain-containing protein [Puniceicoccales bacterium]
MLRLEDVSVAYGKGDSVLRSLNLSLDVGEFLTVVGPNGSGKSTLLKAIAGAVPLRRGRISIGGKATDFRSVSYVFQDPTSGTVGDFTVLENMALAWCRGKRRFPVPFLNNFRRKIFRDRLADLNMGLEDRLTVLVRSLSGGQRQALALAMAILRESPLLLLDEVTAALDPSSAERVMALADRIVRQSGRSCIAVTHSLQQAISYGDRLLVLREGAVTAQFSGKEKSNLSAVELFTRYAR